MSAFGGKADILDPATSGPLSAYDPKRSLAGQICCAAQTQLSLSDVVGWLPRQGTTHEAARVHYASRRRGGVATRGGGAAVGNAGDRRDVPAFGNHRGAQSFSASDRVKRFGIHRE